MKKHRGLSLFLIYRTIKQINQADGRDDQPFSIKYYFNRYKSLAKPKRQEHDKICLKY